MSLQKHFHRDEIWFVSQGECVVNFSTSPEHIKEHHLKSMIVLMSKKMNGIK